MDPDVPQRRVFSDRIPPADPAKLADALGHDVPRGKVKSIIDEYVGQVTFEELVMRYAGKEIERRSLGTMKFWAITVLSTIVTAVIASVATIIFGTHHA
jgi:hypothetical protein